MGKSEIRNQKSEVRSQKKKFLILIFLFSVFCSLFSVIIGCGRKTGETYKEVIPVKVMKVELKEIKKTLDYVGDIKAQDEAVVYPKVNGKIIEKVKADGEAITKGEAIAYIDRDEVGLQFEPAPIESPLTGIVGRVYVDIGTNVTPQTPIALVVNMDRVKIELQIPEIYLPKISLAQKATITVDAYPQEEFLGEIRKVSPIVELATRAAPVEIIVDNSQHRLKSGMFARVSLVIQEEKNVPVILKEAIMGKEPEAYVYVVENKKAVLRKVSLGIWQGPYYEIREGLQEGDLVVIMGQQRLDDGAAVNMEIEKE